MTVRFHTLAGVASLDVPGRVIRYSRDRGRTWHYGCLTGKSENALDTIASGMGIVLRNERSCSGRYTILTENDFRNGFMVEQATVDDAMGRTWWE